MHSLIDSVQNFDPVVLCGISCLVLTNFIDQTFKTAFHDCCTKLYSIVELILSSPQIFHLIKLYETKMNQHFLLIKKMTGFHFKENQNKSINLKESGNYYRLTFYQLFQKRRV